MPNYNFGLPLPAYFDLDAAKSWDKEEDFYSFFESNAISLLSAIDILVKVNTILSMYVLIRILCVDSIISRFGWSAPCKEDINNLPKEYKSLNLFKALKVNLLCVLDSGILVIDKLQNTPIRDLSYEDFHKAFERYAYRARRNFRDKNLPLRRKINENVFVKDSKSGNVYDKHDYGLSDW